MTPTRPMSRARRLPAALAAVLFTALASCASPPAPPPPPAARPSAGPVPQATPATASLQQEREVKRLPDVRLPEMRFDAVPLDSVLETIHNASGLTIEVKWDELKAADVDRKTPISARLFNVKVSKALDVIVNSAGDGCHRLAWTTAGDRAVVTTRDDFIARDTEEREYDVRDLLVNVWTDGKGAEKTRAARVEDLTRLITDTVNADSWITAGGKPGFIMEKDGVLFITQTKENHRQLVNLFEQLRETHPPDPPRQGLPAPEAPPPATRPRE